MTAETAESKGLFLRIRKVAREWKEYEEVVMPNGFCKVNAPQRHRLVLKEAILSSEGVTNINTHDGGGGVDGTVEKLNSQRPKPGNTPLYAAHHSHTLYLEARDAVSLHMSRTADVVGKYDIETLAFENVPANVAIEGNTIAPLTMETYDMLRWNPEEVTSPADEAGWRINETTPVLREPHIRHRMVRHDDAAHFTLKGEDVKTLQFRVCTPEEHSLKWLVDHYYIDEDADLNLEMWFVYERYTPQQQQPQHFDNHFVGYYKSAITDQHGV